MAFTVESHTENGINTILLKDLSNSTNAAIIPASGALLHTFSVEHEGGALNIIEQYANATDLERNITSGGFKSCKLSPFVCRMQDGRYQFGGLNHKIEKFYLGDHALHGLLYDVPFIVTRQYADDEKAVVELTHQYRRTDPGYPFNYDCIITYELRANNDLRISTSIINKEEGLIPVADGWHPYFGFGGSINDLQLEFQSKEMLEFNEELIPTGKLMPYEKFGSLTALGDTSFDNCFTLNFAECQPLCLLRDPVKKIQLEIFPDKSYPYLQIYTPPHRRSIAIENLSAAPDAFNNGMGLMVLGRGEIASFKTRFVITSLT